LLFTVEPGIWHVEAFPFMLPHEVIAYI